MKKKLLLRILYSIILGLLFGAATYALSAIVLDNPNLPFRTLIIDNTACDCIGKICPMCVVVKREFFLIGAVLNLILFSTPWAIAWSLFLNRKKKVEEVKA